jgi:hypothetical protein
LTPDTRLKGSDQPLTDKLENLEEGDKILFKDRKEPLTVTSMEKMEMKGEETFMGGLKGSQGADYTVIQSLANPDIATVESMALNSEPIVISDFEVVKG